jgi:NADH dehydrogenase
MQTLGIAALFAPDPEMAEADKPHSYKKETALTQPRVVIVGGGFGGLYAARALAGAPVSVTLIDKRNYHLFRPLLYQVATGLLSADEISGPLRSILSRQNNIDVLLGEVTGVDTQKRVVRLEQHDIPYDFLVLATGVQYNYFGHDEWSRIAPGLVSLSDADRIRAKVLLAFEQAEELAALDLAQTTSPQIQKLLTFVLVGAGTVGVEIPARWQKCRAWLWHMTFIVSMRGVRGFCCMKRRRVCFRRILRSSRPGLSAI